jgi:Fuc2NAc and GlcNAc transferase
LGNYIPYLVLTVAGSFSIAVILTWVAKNYALRTGILDSPNERSSHSIDTPRGGGVGVVVPMLIALSIMMMNGSYDRRTLIVFLFVVILLAIVGWLDDRYGLHFFVRIIAQILGGVVVLGVIGSFEYLEIAANAIPLNFLAPVITLLWFLWMTNLYNFMDGIDGIAAGQGAIAGCFLGIWFTIHDDHVMALFSYVIMAASLGFLVWNWAPARVFMGDVGSSTLGGVFAVIALVAYKTHQIPFGAFVLLFGVFLADATVTLIKRILQGKVFWKAHREHLYQRAVIAGWSHAQVTTTVIITSIFMAILGTLEMLHVSPVYLWVPLGMFVLGVLALIVRKKCLAIDK